MRRLLALAGVFAAVVIISCTGCASTAAASSAADTTPTPAPSGTPTAAEGPAKPKVKAGASEQAASAGKLADLSAAVAPVIKSDGGHAAVAVDDLATGQQASYNGTDNDFVTASIVKVDILATLLYQSQRAGESLSAGQRELATTMIENSNNDAASDLYDDDGEATGIDAANKAFGLTDTAVGTDGYWGLTTTTVTDQIKLLRQVFTSESVLSAASRSYIRDLMSQVEADQRWGVSAAASGGDYLVKNGWLPNPDLWEINSIGEVTRDGQQLLIAVLSAGNQSEDGGIDLVQQIARDAASAISG